MRMSSMSMIESLIAEKPEPIARVLKEMELRTSIWTGIRWAKDGVKGFDGEMIHLEAFKLGSRWHTSRKAIIRFLKRVQDAERERTHHGESKTSTSHGAAGGYLESISLGREAKS